MLCPPLRYSLSQQSTHHLQLICSPLQNVTHKDGVDGSHQFIETLNPLLGNSPGYIEPTTWQKHTHANTNILDDLGVNVWKLAQLPGKYSSGLLFASFCSACAFIVLFDINLKSFPIISGAHIHCLLEHGALT